MLEKSTIERLAVKGEHFYQRKRMDRRAREIACGKHGGKQIAKSSQKVAIVAGRST